jgi:hypothetical protein
VAGHFDDVAGLTQRGSSRVEHSLGRGSSGLERLTHRGNAEGPSANADIARPSAAVLFLLFLVFV